MDYSKLSDMEINGRVLHAITNGKAIRIQQASVASGETDYCNNPADAWPIIVGNKICLSCKPNRDDWDAFTLSDKGYTEEVTYDPNPLRAAMIVFLMMQGDE